MSYDNNVVISINVCYYYKQNMQYIYNFLDFITKNESIYLIKYPILFNIYVIDEDYYTIDDYVEYDGSDEYYYNNDKKIINKYIIILNEMKQDINKYKFKVCSAD